MSESASSSSTTRSSSPLPFGSSQSVNGSGPVDDLDSEQQCFRRLYLNLKAQVDTGDDGSVRGEKGKQGDILSLENHSNSPELLTYP